MITNEEEMPAFFRDLQDLANKHEVLVYATVAVVLRDGKAVMATAGGSKLPDGDQSRPVYESLAKAFDGVIERLSAVPDKGMLN